MIDATWMMRPPDRSPWAESMVVRAEADVDELLRRLALPRTDDAYLSDGTDSMRCAACIDHGRLYLAWADATFTGAPDGDPESPQTHGSTEEHYYPGTGVSIDLGSRALKQWLATGRRPDLLTWVDTEVLYERQYGRPLALTPEEQAELDAMLAPPEGS